MNEPAPLPFLHPATLIATWFGSGLLPKAPGTWGSLAALPPAAGLILVLGPWGLFGAAALLFALGTWAGGRYAVAKGRDDPGDVVVDEVVSQWLVVLPLGQDFTLYPLAFVAFRFFDIVKLWPASWLDRKLKGGFGIMADDLAAAGYAAALCSGVAMMIG